MERAPRLPRVELGERRIVVDEADSGSEPQTSARLVAGIRAGDPSAEQQMVERYSRGLLYLLLRRCGDSELALDVRQDTLRIAIEKLRTESINDASKLAAFLRGIALNVLKAHRRKTERRATIPDSARVEAEADERRGPYDHVSSQQAQQAVRTLLAELRTPRDREVLTRLYLNDEDRDAICADLGIDSVHFSRVLLRAKQRFKEILQAAERRDRMRLVG